MVVSRMSKVREFPRHHDTKLNFTLSCVIGGKQATIIPLTHYDEATAASTIFANPEHASFAEYAGSNVFPESKIFSIECRLKFSLTKACWVTDQIEQLRFMVMPIVMSFKDNYTAIDNLSSLEVQDVLELQFETTDKQGGALYSGTKLAGDDLDLGTDTPFLTTNTNIEGVAFDPNVYYDSVHYLTNANKIRASVGQPRYYTVQRRKGQQIKVRFNNSKVKFANEYMFCGVLVMLFDGTSPLQFHQASEDTAIEHMIVKASNRFMEWNHNFQMQKA